MEASLNHAGGAAFSCLDLVWIIDCTGSMGSYIASATTNVEAICEEILKSERLASPDALRLAVVAYRDYPLEYGSFVTRSLPFTSDISKVKEFLQGLYAWGGWDGPEAVTTALKEALEMEWRINAGKAAVLICDAPPHGIGEDHDDFSQGLPDCNDPLVLARQMAILGISLFVVACEPELSEAYTYATDFYHALAEICTGRVIPLTDPSLLAQLIIGTSVEQMDIERLIQEFGAPAAAMIRGDDVSVDDVAKQLHERLTLRNEVTVQPVFKTVYRESAEAEHNVSVYRKAEDLASAKPLLKRITGITRFTDEYYEQLHGAGSIDRSSTWPATPSSAPSSASVGSPASPSRRVVSSFAAFKMSVGQAPMNPPRNVTPHPFFGSSAPLSSLSEYGTAQGAGTGIGPGSAFGSFRSINQSDSTMDDDDDDDGAASGRDDGSDGEAAGGIAFKRGGATLEQAKRIVMSSAWRGMRT